MESRTSSTSSSGSSSFESVQEEEPISSREQRYLHRALPEALATAIHNIHRASTFRDEQRELRELRAQGQEFRAEQTMSHAMMTFVEKCVDVVGANIRGLNEQKQAERLAHVRDLAARITYDPDFPGTLISTGCAPYELIDEFVRVFLGPAPTTGRGGFPKMVFKDKLVPEEFYTMFPPGTEVTKALAAIVDHDPFMTSVADSIGPNREVLIFIDHFQRLMLQKDSWVEPKRKSLRQALQAFRVHANQQIAERLSEEAQRVRAAREEAALLEAVKAECLAATQRRERMEQAAKREAMRQQIEEERERTRVLRAEQTAAEEQRKREEEEQKQREIDEANKRAREEKQAAKDARKKQRR
jgi:hypothetical protein